jgi:hypothetical protein
VSAVTTVWAAYPGIPGHVELEVVSADRPQDWDECETCGTSAPGVRDPLTAIHSCHPCLLKSIAMGTTRIVAAE